jgi:hypothetical protein
LLGLALGSTVSRRWYLLSAGVASFLLQHAIQGWCPPVPIFRGLGVRTAHEIEQERHALKALRGDYCGIMEVTSKQDKDQVARLSQAFEAAGANSKTN